MGRSEFAHAIRLIKIDAINRMKSCEINIDDVVNTSLKITGPVKRASKINDELLRLIYEYNVDNFEISGLKFVSPPQVTQYGIVVADYEMDPIFLEKECGEILFSMRKTSGACMTKVALNSLSFLNTLEQIARDIWTSDDLELWGGGGLHLEDNVEKYANIAGGDQYRDFYEFWMLGLKK